MKKFALVTFIALFALSGVALAKGQGDGNQGKVKFWERERIVEALSLTEEEISQLSERSTAHREKVQELREQMRAERNVLREVMGSSEFSESLAQKHFENAENLRTEMSRERFQMKLAHRELLGQERYQELREMVQTVRAKRQGKRSWQENRQGKGTWQRGECR